MIKKNQTLLLLTLFLLNFVNISTATQNRNVDIDRSSIPKNILIGSFSGGRSHLKPMLDIAAILIERGYNIVLLTTGKYESSSEYPSVKQVSLGPQITLRDLKEDVHKEFDHKGLAKLVEISVKLYNQTYEKYKNTAEEYNIDLFFCDYLINEACLDIAHALKKPVVGWTAALQIMDSKPYKSDPIGLLLSPFLTQLNDIRKQINVEPNQVTFGKVPKEVSLALVDTFFGFELPQSLPPNVQEIGPVISEEYSPLTPELSNFMNTHERVLYVAFGTIHFTTPENNNKILQSILEAINKNMIDGVIWALVQTSKDDFYPTLNLTDGSTIQTSSILNNEHPHIHIVKFAPQFAILNHTNTKLYFSHGGAGSTHESLYTGTPMLVLPFGADQMGNAQKLKIAGVALSLSIYTLDVNDIINKMDHLLNKIAMNHRR
ncbi:Glycosyltransferase Family 1 protein [Glomus cerebriforme]|uniref:Glycosyltransferase Family 1 protein n=1 Tax=Glomus cerebriforme TaxID=658196 RepID=A0A397SWU0_9GLOM|nr:Glycosyltransferase Family 1 protein [Glomus cerebriforme]